MSACDCARGYMGVHKQTCSEFPPATVLAQPATVPHTFIGNPTTQERLTIARARVERRKQELDNAVTEYALACQTLAVAIERAERASEIPTEPANEKPDA